MKAVELEFEFRLQTAHTFKLEFEGGVTLTPKEDLMNGGLSRGREPDPATPLLDWKLGGERFHSLRLHTEA